jgi:hypothetical protein|tara:strand:+ start:784 stop:978 length:195 start_codon:yes stop_codon:yes gene_type:complete
MLILIVIGITNPTQIVVLQMSKEKETDWDEKQWKKFWKDRREGRRKMWELLSKEDQGLKGSQLQ